MPRLPKQEPSAGIVNSVSMSTCKFLTFRVYCSETFGEYDLLIVKLMSIVNKTLPKNSQFLQAHLENIIVLNNTHSQSKRTCISKNVA